MLTKVTICCKYIMNKIIDLVTVFLGLILLERYVTLR